jgi:hypothetical protein
MKTTSIFSLLLLASLGTITLSSCNGASVDKVKSLESSYENQNQKVELVGEFDAPGFTFSSNNSKTIRMHFVVKSNAFSSEKFVVTDVTLPMGAERNSVVMNLAPDQKNYSLKDFTVYDKSGEKHNLDQHPQFRITGTVTYDELNRPEEERRADNYGYKLTDVSIEKD